jgi:hypothetical protein
MTDKKHYSGYVYNIGKGIAYVTITFLRGDKEFNKDFEVPIKDIPEDCRFSEAKLEVIVCGKDVKFIAPNITKEVKRLMRQIELTGEIK